MAENILGCPERQPAVALSAIKAFFCNTQFRNNRRVLRSSGLMAMLIIKNLILLALLDH